MRLPASISSDRKRQKIHGFKTLIIENNFDGRVVTYCGIHDSTWNLNLTPNKKKITCKNCLKATKNHKKPKPLTPEEKKQLYREVAEGLTELDERARAIATLINRIRATHF